MAIGERIRRIRIFRKMTQSQLGEAVGLSDVRIRQYEIGNRTPKEEMIEKIAKALNCNFRSIYDKRIIPGRSGYLLRSQYAECKYDKSKQVQTEKS